MIHTFALISIGFYLIFLGAGLRALIFQHPQLGKISIALEALAITVHSLAAVLMLAEVGLQAKWSELFFYLALAIAIFDFLLRFKISFPVVSVCLLTLVILLFFSSSILMHYGKETTLNFKILTYVLHVFPASMAILTQFLILLCSGAVVLFSRSLKNKNARIVFLPMPAVADLKKWLEKLALISFISWTVTLVSGGVYSVLRQQSFFYFDFVNYFTLVAWILAALLFVKIIFKQRGFSNTKLAFLSSAFIISVFFAKSFLISNAIHTFTLMS